MDFFNDRRDVSNDGLKRREFFEQLMRMLTESKIAHAVARRELLKVVKGENSTVLDKLGIHIQNR